MAHFTDTNTDGYTVAELATLNEAFDRLVASGMDNDMNRLDDMLANSWFDGATADDLVKTVSKARA